MTRLPLYSLCSRLRHAAYWRLPSRSSSHSAAINTRIDNAVLQDHALDIFNTAINSVLPQSMVTKALKMHGDRLTVGDQTFNLNCNVYVVAFGKAVIGMVKAAEDVLGEHIVDGVASVPVGIQENLKQLGKWDLLPSNQSRVEIIEGAANNIPDSNAHKAAMKIYKLLDSLTENDLVLALYSGGGSALLPSPVPPVTLEDMAEVTRILSRSGANIQQVNTVRKHLELLKGGGLAKTAYPAKVIGLVMSDVVGNDPQFIASGPTSPNTTTAQQCLDLLRSLEVLDIVPSSVSKILTHNAKSSQGLTDMESKEFAALEYFPEREEYRYKNATTHIIGSNDIALETSQRRARVLGYLPYVLSNSLVGEARKTGELFAKLASFMCQSKAHHKNMDGKHLIAAEIDLIKSGLEKGIVNELRQLGQESVNTNTPICVLGAGETTVNVTGSGRGGRNQEMALSCAVHLNEIAQNKDVFRRNVVEFLSGGTDGQDGPTDVAGALANPQTVPLALKDDIEPIGFLDNNDSYTFYNQLKNGRFFVKTGLTGTNVMDIQCLLIQHQEYHSAEFS